MAHIELPPPAAVDRTRAGILTVALPVLAELLGLPAGHEVVGAKINTSGDLDLLIEGGALPPRKPDGSAEPVTMVVTVYGRMACGVFREMREAAWAHAPDDRWELRPWGERR